MRSIPRHLMHSLLNCVLDNYITLEQLSLYFEPEFDPCNQEVKTWQEIRADWFARNLVYRGVKVTRPEWVERAVRERTIVLTRDEARRRYTKHVEPIKSYIVHYMQRMDKVYVPLVNQVITVNGLNECKTPSYNQFVEGSGLNFVKKIPPVDAMIGVQKPVNATTEAIERLAFLAIYRDM